MTSLRGFVWRADGKRRPLLKGRGGLVPVVLRGGMLKVGWSIHGRLNTDGLSIRCPMDACLSKWKGRGDEVFGMWKFGEYESSEAVCF